MTPNKGESVQLPWQTACVSLSAGPDPKACSLRARYTKKLFTAFKQRERRRKKKQGEQGKKYSGKEKNTSGFINSLLRSNF